MNQHARSQLIFLDQRAGNERIGFLGGIVALDVAEKAVTLGMQLEDALSRAGHFLTVRADGRSGTHLVLLHWPGTPRSIVAVLVVLEVTAPRAAASAAAMLLAGSLVVVATLVRPTTTSTTPTATGHSGGIVIASSSAASAVVRPVAPLRAGAGRIDIGFGNVGLEVVRVVVPRLDGIIHARAEVVLVGRGFLDGLFFHDFRRGGGVRRRPREGEPELCSVIRKSKEKGSANS